MRSRLLAFLVGVLIGVCIVIISGLLFEDRHTRAVIGSQRDWGG